MGKVKVTTFNSCNHPVVIVEDKGKKRIVDPADVAIAVDSFNGYEPGQVVPYRGYQSLLQGRCHKRLSPAEVKSRQQIAKEKAFAYWKETAAIRGASPWRVFEHVRPLPVAPVWQILGKFLDEVRRVPMPRQRNKQVGKGTGGKLAPSSSILSRVNRQQADHTRSSRVSGLKGVREAFLGGKE